MAENLEFFLPEDGFELPVPRRERSEALSGTGTVMEAIKVRLEAVRTYWNLYSETHRAPPTTILPVSQ